MKSKQIVDFIKQSYKQPEWAVLEELRCGVGYKSQFGDWWNQPGCWNPEQRIDAFAINCYPSRKFETISFEVKVSRSDFKNEIATPWKREQAVAISNRFYFATPKGLVKPEEIPEDCGLIEFSDKGRIRHIIKAPHTEREQLVPETFLAAVARNMNKASYLRQENQYLKDHNQYLEDVIREMNKENI